MTEEEILKLARLARLSLDQAEVQKMAKELGSIIEYVKQLEEVDTSSVEPMSHVHGSVNILREDVVQPSTPIEDVLKNAPDSSGRFIRVPIIIEGQAE